MPRTTLSASQAPNSHTVRAGECAGSASSRPNPRMQATPHPMRS